MYTSQDRGYNIPPSVLQEIAAAMTRTVNARGGFNVTFTPELIQGLTPLTFVQLLHDWRLLSFRQDPEQVADAALRGQATSAATEAPA